MEKKIFGSREEYKSLKNFKAAYPGAAKIVRVEGGWMAFATLDDYRAWKMQK